MIKEVDVSVTVPFLLTKPDFSKTRVVKTYVHTIVVPEMDYWKETIEVKKGTQLGRMKTVVCLFYCHSKSVWSNLIVHVTKRIPSMS